MSDRSERSLDAVRCDTVERMNPCDNVTIPSTRYIPTIIMPRATTESTSISPSRPLRMVSVISLTTCGPIREMTVLHIESKTAMISRFLCGLM